MEMSASGRWVGVFWIAGTVDQVPGVLQWDPAEGTRLELFGGFQPERHPDLGADEAWDEVDIFGVTPSGMRLTLWSAHVFSTSQKSQGAWISQFWNAPWLLQGGHISGDLKQGIASIELKMDDLYWLSSTGHIAPPRWIEMEETEIVGREAITPWALPVAGGRQTAAGPVSQEAWIYEITTEATRPWISPATESMPDLKLAMMTRRTRAGVSLLVSATATAHAISSEPRTLDRDLLLPAVSPFIDLVHLATFRRPGIHSMVVHLDDGDSLHVYCHLAGNAAPDERIGGESPVFTLRDLPFEKFLASRERLASTDQANYALRVALGIIDHHPKTVEEGLSQTLAAAEGFHTWCLKERVADGNLAKRLISLHDALPSAAKEALAIPVAEWSDWARWARNHVDHAGVRQYRELSSTQMQRLRDSVALVLYLRMLDAWGVPAACAEEAILNHPRLRALTQRCQQLELPDHPAPNSE